MEIELFFVSLTLENFFESRDQKDSQAKLFHKVPVSKSLLQQNILYHHISGTIHDRGQQGRDAVDDLHIQYSYLIKLKCLKSNFLATAGKYSKTGSGEYFNNV